MAKQKGKPRTGAKGLTQKQAKFCVEFMRCGNASEAYRRSYSTKRMKPSSVWTEACELMQNPHVSRRIKELQQQALDAANITEQRVVEELAKLAFTNMEDFSRVDSEGHAVLDLSNATREQMAAIVEITTDTLKTGSGDDQISQTVKTKVKLASKQAALDSLGKYMGLFVDRVAHEGKDGEAIKIDTGDRELAKAVALTLQKGMKK